MNEKSEETPKDTEEEEAKNAKNFEEEHNEYKSPFLVFENNNYTINNLWSYWYSYLILTGIHWRSRSGESLAELLVQ